MQPIIETERFYLRDLKLSDANELFKILGDKESMRYYPRPFSKREVELWIKRNIKSYHDNKFGLWAVICKKNGLFLGECGITIQNIDGEQLPELGYHINKRYWNKGFASEAAKECIRYAFETLSLKVLYSYINIDNRPSIQVAKKNDMKYLKRFRKKVLGEIISEVLYSIKEQSI